MLDNSFSIGISPIVSLKNRVSTAFVLIARTQGKSKSNLPNLESCFGYLCFIMLARMH